MLNETLLVVLKSVFIVLALSPIWGAFLIELWEQGVRPLLISKEELVQEAEKLIRQYGTDACDIALSNEYRAWRYSDSFQKARWRRIRKKIEKLSTGRDNS